MVKKKEAEENGEGVQHFAVKGTEWKEESGEDKIGKDELEDELGEKVDAVGQEEGEIIKVTVRLKWRINRKRLVNEGTILVEDVVVDVVEDVEGMKDEVGDVEDDEDLVEDRRKLFIPEE